jgi:cytosolic 5'-nucleotidase 3
MTDIKNQEPHKHNSNDSNNNNNNTTHDKVIEYIQQLEKNKNILLANQNDLNKKIEKLVEEGIQKVHIVSDFDRTITKCYVNGKKIPSVFAIIRSQNYLGEEYTKKATELASIYHPIEINAELPFEFRYMKMQEWWEKHRELLIESHITEDIIDKIISENKEIFRSGFIQFAKKLKQKNVPLLIFSAGIGNFIVKYLKSHNLYGDNSFIFSNTFIFDNKKKAIGFEQKAVHILNKNEKSYENKDYYKRIEGRTNVILLGDMIEDIGMVENHNQENKHITIKIGFLNENQVDLKSKYLKSFDIVIQNDGDFSSINKLLKLIA